MIRVKVKLVQRLPHAKFKYDPEADAFYVELDEKMFEYESTAGLPALLFHINKQKQIYEVESVMPRKNWRLKRLMLSPATSTGKLILLEKGEERDVEYEYDPQREILHIKVIGLRPTTRVQVADTVMFELDKAGFVAGVWISNISI